MSAYAKQIVMTVLLFPSCQLALAQARDVPVDSNVRIVAPSPEIAKEARIFSGKWAGSFNGFNTGAYMTDAFLAVEEIVSPATARVHFAHIGRHNWNRGEKLSARVEANLQGGTMVFTVPDGREVSCTVRGEDALECTMPTAGRGRLKRIKD